MYKFVRLPFWVNVASAILQQIMNTMLSGLDFAVAYLEDILINSENIKQHKSTYVKSRSIKDYGFKLKDKKCDFFMKEIKYLGQIIDKDGRTPDPNRVCAIKSMLAPENVCSLQSFLGVINYYNIFMPDMHNLCAPQNERLKKRMGLGSSVLESIWEN